MFDEDEVYEGELVEDYWEFDPYDEHTDEELELWEQELLEEFLASADADDLEFLDIIL